MNRAHEPHIWRSYDFLTVLDPRGCGSHLIKKNIWPKTHFKNLPTILEMQQEYRASLLKFRIISSVIAGAFFFFFFFFFTSLFIYFFSLKLLYGLGQPISNFTYCYPISEFCNSSFLYLRSSIHSLF